jgi:hypothetical protein
MRTTIAMALLVFVSGCAGEAPEGASTETQDGAATGTTPSGALAGVPVGASSVAVSADAQVVARPLSDRFLLHEGGSRLAREVLCDSGSPVLLGGEIACTAGQPELVYVHIAELPSRAEDLAEMDLLELRTFRGELESCGMDETLKRELAAFRQTVPANEASTLYVDAFVQRAHRQGEQSTVVGAGPVEGDAPHARALVDPSQFPELVPVMLMEGSFDTEPFTSDMVAAEGTRCSCGGWGMCSKIFDQNCWCEYCADVCWGSCSLVWVPY